jgi:hypothetical protein
VARIRTIKPEFFTSLTVASLPIEARLTFVGLWTHVDDEGRCVDDARLIKAAVWPLDDRLSTDIELDLKRLSESSLILRYRVADRSYLAVRGWAEHQRINRPTKSKLPAPPAATEPPPASDGTSPPTAETTGQAIPEPPGSETSPQPHAHLSEGSRQERKGTGNREQGREQGTPRASARTRSNLNPESDPDFMQWWRTYPNPQKRPVTYQSWLKATKTVSVAELQALTTRYAEAERRRGTEQQYIPHSSTWLNQERWRDPIPAFLTPAGANGHRPFTNPTDVEDAYGGTL